MRLLKAPGSGSKLCQKERKKTIKFLSLFNKKRPVLNRSFFIFEILYYLVPFTRKACITPGIQPNAVNNKLIKKVTPKPCLRKTASGGNRIFSTIVSIDIILVLLVNR